MPLRLRITRDGLRITGGAPGGTRRHPPQPQLLLRTDAGDLLVTERGDHLILDPSDGQ